MDTESHQVRMSFVYCQFPLWQHTSAAEILQTAAEINLSYPSPLFPLSLPSFLLHPSVYPSTSPSHSLPLSFPIYSLTFPSPSLPLNPAWASDGISLALFSSITPYMADVIPDQCWWWVYASWHLPCRSALLVVVVGIVFCVAVTGEDFDRNKSYRMDDK